MSRMLILVVLLFVSGCGSPIDFSTIPEVSAGKGRLFFFGENRCTYDGLTGGVYAPSVVVDGVMMKHGNGSAMGYGSVYFYKDFLPGTHRITVDDPGFTGRSPDLTLDIMSGKTTYVLMEVHRVETKSMLRLVDVFQEFTVLTEDQAMEILNTAYFDQKRGMQGGGK